MISSMTGYGRAENCKDNLIIEAEIKSFNNRFLDIGIRLPKSISQEEFNIRNLIRSKISRGKIALVVSLKHENSDHKNGFVDVDALKSVINSIEAIKTVGNIDGDVTLDNILTLQALFLTESALESEEIRKLVIKTVSEAIEKLIEMRHSEGSELEKDMLNRLQNISDTVEKIESMNSSSIEEYFDKLRERAEKILNEKFNNEERMLTELSLLAEKYDVTEECVRLNSHVKLFGDTLTKSKDAGRRLNFICQEMNREANTINSKTVSSEVAHWGIFIKEELEKIREQVQNIE